MQSILIPHQDKQRRVRDGSEKSPRGRSLFPSVQRDRNSERSRAPFLSSLPSHSPWSGKSNASYRYYRSTRKIIIIFLRDDFARSLDEAAKIARKLLFSIVFNFFRNNRTTFLFSFFFLSPRHANWNEGREEIKKKNSRKDVKRTNERVRQFLNND